MVIGLVSPNGGESWQIGTVQTITWTSINTGANVAITGDLDGNGSYETSITASTPTVNGSFNWTVAGAANNNCRIDVKDTLAATHDSSNAVFAITSAPITGSITIVSPVGGQTYSKGSSVVLSWTTTNVTGNVKIELSRNNGGSWETVYASTPYNSTDLTFTASVPSSSLCRIKITSLNDTNVTATSAAFRLGGQIM